MIPRRSSWPSPRITCPRPVDLCSIPICRCRPTAHLPIINVSCEAVRAEYHRQYGTRLFSAYLQYETQAGERTIGATGSWQWLAAFAPEGFFEIWGILPGVTSLRQAADDDWQALAQGVLNTQKFYRSLGRNGYNLGLLLLEDGSDDLELRVVLTVRSNYAPWVRSDFTGFEVMLGDMATFSAPELTAEKARPFWQNQTLPVASGRQTESR